VTRIAIFKGEPSAALMSRRTKLIIALVGLLFFGVLALNLWLLGSKWTVWSVERLVRRELPIRTPRAQVESWPRPKGWGYVSATYNEAIQNAIDNGKAPNKNSASYGSMARFDIWPAYAGFLATGSISVYLLFDHDDHLIFVGFRSRAEGL